MPKKCLCHDCKRGQESVTTKLKHSKKDNLIFIMMKNFSVHIKKNVGALAKKDADDMIFTATCSTTNIFVEGCGSVSKLSVEI